MSSRRARRIRAAAAPPGRPRRGAAWVAAGAIAAVMIVAFAAFVKATRYVTVAERTPRAEEFPGAPPENLVAGSVVFSPPDHAVPLTDRFQWWAYARGASWRHPLGPDSSIDGKDRLPVVHVAYETWWARAARATCRPVPTTSGSAA